MTVRKVLPDGSRREYKNLRIVLDYARRDPVTTAYITAKENGGADVMIVYDNGTLIEAEFASYKVAKAWFNSRRSWDRWDTFVSPDERVTIMSFNRWLWD